MSLSPRLKKWALISTIAGLNVACLADGLQASKATYSPDAQGDLASHMYATKAIGPVFKTSAWVGGVFGVAGAYTAATAVGMVSLPGLLGGEYLGKALYKPAQPQP